MVTRRRQKTGVFFIILCGTFTAVPSPSMAIGAEKPPVESLKVERKVSNLLDSFLSGPMAGTDEIIFACRHLNYDPHWYANFGYYADNAERKAYRAMGRYL